MGKCINCGEPVQGSERHGWEAVCASCGKLTWIAVSQIRTVEITKLTGFGACAYVANGTEGLIHISELSAMTIDDPSEVVNVGDLVSAIVLRVDMDQQKIALSIKRVAEN